MFRIYDVAPTAGLVIGTFAAIPYIHLHLECRRRYFPGLPVLVSDDGSPFRDQLSALCTEYGAEFRSNSVRHRRTVGDMSAYVHGLDWAASRGITLLVKMSRRFIPMFDWVPALQDLALRSQMPTFSQVCDHFRFGFRTECIGFHTQSWRDSGACSRMQSHVDLDKPVFVEGFVHQLARDVAQRFACDIAREYIQISNRPKDRDGYGVWEIMPDRRTTRRPDLLWHDSCGPVDYWQAAVRFGLSYTLRDFQDLNQGCGRGPR